MPLEVRLRCSSYCSARTRCDRWHVYHRDRQRPLAENVADLPGLTEGQVVVQPWDAPIKDSGHLQILRGNLAPEGAVAKITGKEGLRFSGLRAPSIAKRTCFPLLSVATLDPAML